MISLWVSVQAIERVLAAGSVDPSALGFVSLSTTLATNALVEGRGRPAALVIDRVRGGRARPGWFARSDRPRFGGDRLRFPEGIPHTVPKPNRSTPRRLRAVTEIAPSVDGFACHVAFSVRND